jgi:hypothetical protein
VTVGGLASNGSAFTVSPSAPSITSLSPTSGAVGTSVTITGTNFGSSQGSSTVAFNGTAATPTSWSATSIVVPVPSGASTGNVVVTVGGLASNGSAFTVTAGSESMVTGTASLGTPVVGAAVTLRDANGNTSTGTTASDGTFTLDTGGFTPPFLVSVVTVASSGSFPVGTTLYSVSADANATTTINVHVLSDLLVRSWYSAQGVDADSAFANPVISSNVAPSPLAVQMIATTVIQVMQLWFNSAGISVTSGTPGSAAAVGGPVSQSVRFRLKKSTPSPADSGSSCSSSTINFISSPFIANGTCLDSVLDDISSESVNSSTGAVSTTTVASGSVTETVTPAYSAGTITVNTTTTNSSTNTTSSESITAVALTSAQQTDINAINAQLTAFENTVNTDGASLTGTDLLPYFASDYLNDGDNATEDAAGFASEIAGLTLTSLQTADILSLNTTTNVADVVVDYTESGQTGTGTQDFFFKNEGGSWLIYGDQRIGQITAITQSRTSQGANSLGGAAGALTEGIYVGAQVQAPTSFDVTGATVSGGGSIWHGGPTDTLLQQPTIIQGSPLPNLDDFIALSQPLTGTSIPVAGTQFTINVTTTSSYGNPQYTVASNASTTETVAFSGISTTVGSGPLASLLGQTVTYNWSALPTSFAVSQVNLYAYISDANSNTCSPISLTANLAVNATSGTITFPSNMSACGLAASDAITAVGVFLEVSGTNGEDIIVQLSYPY